MARKSRIAEQQAPFTLPERIYKVGLYVRLSVLDSGKKDSDTIETQEAILRRYIEGKPYFSLVSVYVDNGRTGVSFERDEFEHLLEDVRIGRVDCIIVKDLSRFGRNYIEAGEYLEMVFPIMGIRFIAINDRYDSLDPSASDSLATHLKNLVNDVYARDISHKICPVLHAKQERGEFIGAWAAYGYLKSAEDKHRLVVDEETAPVVRDIFIWRVMGNSLQQIARMLRERNIPSPGEYRFAKGLVKDRRLAQVPWKITTIKQLLSNEVYLGHMVQGRKQEALWKGQTQLRVPKEQWIVVKNTHEAIVEEELFYVAQEMNRQATEQYWEKKRRFEHIPNTENILKGLVYCGNCGAKLTRYKKVRENKCKEPKFHVWYNYICPVHAATANLCPFISIPEQDLLSLVSDVIKVQLLAAPDMDKLMKKARFRSTAAEEKRELGQQIAQARASLENVRRHEETLYDDYAQRLMPERDYLSAKKRYQERAKSLRRQIKELEERQRIHSQEKKGGNPWLQAFLQFHNEPLPPRPMALELIDSVVVYSKTRIAVNLRFQEEYQKLTEPVTPQYGSAAYG